jgi:DNA-binding NarL/FixJ family response regulator
MAADQEAREVTKREEDVLRLILAGKTNKEIGEALDMAQGTVKTHLRALFKEFEASTRLQLAMKAVNQGHRPDQPKEKCERLSVFGVQLAQS